jgi:hypothetical protein
MCMISFWGISAQIISLFRNPAHLLNLLDLPLSHFQKTTCIYILLQQTTCIYFLLQQTTCIYILLQKITCIYILFSVIIF